MKLFTGLLAASVLAASFAAPPAHANVDGLAQTLAERDTYNHPAANGWTAQAISAQRMPASKYRAAPTHMTWPIWHSDTNVSPASMDSGLKQIK